MTTGYFEHSLQCRIISLYTYKSTMYKNVVTTRALVSIHAQESEVLSIIGHRGAPQRSLGNYKKTFIVAQRSLRYPSLPYY